jgi:hypothetical protein
MAQVDRRASRCKSRDARRFLQRRAGGNRREIVGLQLAFIQALQRQSVVGAMPGDLVKAHLVALEVTLQPAVPVHQHCDEKSTERKRRVSAGVGADARGSHECLGKRGRDYDRMLLGR